MKLSRSNIKFITVVLMTLNHIGLICLKEQTFLRELFVNAGYVTAITMCYFLVEGVRYTHSMKAYGRRLAALAIVSQIPYDLAFTKGAVLRFNAMNMGFTLFLCFLLCDASLKIQNRGRRFLICAALILASGISDWAFFAPLFTILFLRSGYDRNSLGQSYIFCAALFGIIEFQSLDSYAMPARLLSAAGGVAAILLSGFLILHCYSGRECAAAISNRRAQQYFFYIYYPLHLLILGVIRILVKL